MKLYIWDIGDGGCNHPQMVFAETVEEAREILLAKSYAFELKEKKEIVNGTYSSKYHSIEQLLCRVGESYRAKRFAIRQDPKIYDIVKGIVRMPVVD